MQFMHANLPDSASIRLFTIALARLGSALFCLLLTNAAQAQCRIGSGPDFGDGIPYCSALDKPPQVRSEAPVWQSRWGAIAIDPKVTSGGIGLAKGKESRHAAEEAALRDCHTDGGGNTCRIELSYDNQCGVIAWGDLHYTTANSTSLYDASQLALAACAKHTEHCKIVYADCEFPVRLR